MHRNLGIGSWVARRARMAPGRVALVAGARRWTYAELDQRITRLARGLQALGVGAGDRVAYLGPNHPAALETLFACGLLGAIAVPVHPGFDDAARARVLATAAPAVVVATPEQVAAVRRGRAPRELPQVVTTGPGGDGTTRLEELIEAGSDEPLDRPIALDRVALLAFSSGTTGPNKGVALTHGNLLFNVVNMLGGLDLVRDDVLLVSAPLYRMGGLGFALTVLFKGGTCVLPERGDPASHLRLLEQHRVTVLFDAVGAFEALHAAPAFATADLSSLRLCMTGGSYVPPALVAALLRRGVCLQPAYGLTEAAPLALMVERDEVAAHPAASGRPPMLGDARIVDDALEDVAPGTIGELLVAGPNVTPGYWQAPGATARALVDGWLRTGDAAWADAGGMITVVGRMEDALVLDGRRLHPGRVEGELRARGGLHDGVLVQGEAGAVPTLFVVPAAHPVALDLLVELCRGGLGGVTPVVRVMAGLPRNPNGKVLRHRLRALAATGSAGSTRLVAG